MDYIYTEYEERKTIEAMSIKIIIDRMMCSIRTHEGLRMDGIVRGKK